MCGLDRDGFGWILDSGVRGVFGAGSHFGNAVRLSCADELLSTTKSED